MSVDIENFHDFVQYLARHKLVPDHSQIVLTKLDGGVSNRTILIEQPGKAWVAKQALRRLRVNVEWNSDPARIRQEALALEWLPQFTPPGTVPQLVFHDPDTNILIMDAVSQPHENWKKMLLRGELVADHIVQFAKILSTIHGESSKNASMTADIFHEIAFFESLRIEPYYQYTAGQHPETQHFFQQLIVDTRANRHALVHGDYSPKNVLVYNNQLVLLDYEVMHFGDPAFDVGFSLAHLLSKANHLRDHRQAFIKAASLYWTLYWQDVLQYTWAAEIEARSVRHTLACLLARVDGRSPLEYLDAEARDRQRELVLLCIKKPRKTINDLITDVQKFLTTNG